MPRPKRYVGWSGLHVPLIVHIPEKYKHLRPKDYHAGEASDRIVSFVDLAPTVLSLCEIPKKTYYQGHAFLGHQIEASPRYCFGFVGRADEHPDESRSVFDGRYLYLHNFVPSLPQLKGLTYQMETRTTSQWKELFDAGKLNKIQAEPWSAPKATKLLFDLKTDPYEVKNIIQENPQIATRMASALGDYFVKTGDLGLISEGHLQHALSVEKVTPVELAKTPFYREITQKFQKGEVIASHPGSLNQEQLQAFKERKGKKQPNYLRVLVLDTLMAQRQESAYIDELLIYCDPVKSDAYTALSAYQALRKAKSISSEQYQILKELNTVPSQGTPPRVMKYAQRCKELLLEELKP